jgi:hypothetical protein
VRTNGSFVTPRNSTFARKEKRKRVENLRKLRNSGVALPQNTTRSLEGSSQIYQQSRQDLSTWVLLVPSRSIKMAPNVCDSCENRLLKAVRVGSECLKQTTAWTRHATSRHSYIYCCIQIIQRSEEIVADRNCSGDHRYC